MFMSQDKRYQCEIYWHRDEVVELLVSNEINDRAIFEGNETVDVIGRHDASRDDGQSQWSLCFSIATICKASARL